MKLPKYDVILTTDRTLMSNYHRKEFLGFGTTGPLFVEFPFKFLTRKFHEFLFAPAIKTDKFGRPVEAPYGMRKVEAKLLDAGINAAIVDPDYVPKYLREAPPKILMLSHHDYFGLNPPSSTWSVIVGRDPMNAVFFREFMERIAPLIRRAKSVNNMLVFVGGPAAWQWLLYPELLSKWCIDVVFDGEGERIIVDLVKRAMSNEPIPSYVYSGVEDAPSLEEIPLIKGASINGLVELGRGCPRRCAFCPVTLRPLRWYPLDKIEEEILTNVRAGVKDGILHAEDVPLYGSNSVYPNPDKLLELHKMAKSHYRRIGWSHTTFTTVLVGEKLQGGLMRKIAEIIEDEHQDWWGVQIGLETGSIRLASKVMPAKAAPYGIERWWDVVLESCSIMHEIKLIPAITIIVGIPGETPDDVVQTIELIERMRPYRSLIVPLFYVPMSHIRSEKRGWLDRSSLYPEHIELLRVVFKHSVFWARDIVNRFYLRGPQYFLVKYAVNYFINYVEKKVREIEKSLDAIISELRRK